MSWSMTSVGDPVTVLTIGHSSHSYERFLSLLQSASVTAVADVRSVPYSRHFPQFNSATLKQSLRSDGIAYSFLGHELGGRPRGPELFCDGVADYEAVARTAVFKAGLARVVEGSRSFRIALMCSEQDPADCHRCLLIARALHGTDTAAAHIMSDATVLGHAAFEQRLLQMAGRAAEDMFLSPTARLALAYRERARKVSYAEPPLQRTEAAE